ncbi:MAG: hypothetical protein U0163_05935 [Gemmatimonadaceae bacterium]
MRHPRVDWVRAVAPLIAVAFWAGSSDAQLMKIPPSPPCRVPAGIMTALAPYDGSRHLVRGGVGIVVLPFIASATDGRRDHWPWAIPGGVAELLPRVGGLYVFSQGAVARAMIDADNMPDSAARLLRAQYIVQGTITSRGDRLNISAWVRRASDTTVVWRSEFLGGESLEDIEVSIVDGLYRAIFQRALPELPMDERGLALDALAAGDLASRAGTRAGADQAVAAYTRGLALAPNSALLAVRLARSYLKVLELGGRVPDMTFAAVTNRVQQLTAQALASDSSLSEAWTTRAILARLSDPARFAGAAAAHQRAIQAGPRDADAEHEYGVTLLRLGDDAAAEAHFRRALTLEPSRGQTLTALAEIATRRSRWQEVCVLSNASIGAWQYDAEAYASRANARMRMSQARDAFADAEIAAMLAPGAWVDALRVLMDVAVGDKEQATARARTMVQRWLPPGRTLSVRDAKYMALALTAVGDRRRAVESIKRARPLGADLVTALRDPALAVVRADTAVSRILRDPAARSD